MEERKNNNNLGGQIFTLILAILLFVGTIVFIMVAWHYVFGTIADWEKEKTSYIEKISAIERKERKADNTPADTTIINNYYTYDGSTKIDVSGDNNTIYNNCNNNTADTKAEVVTPVRVNGCFIDGYNAHSYDEGYCVADKNDSTKYRWNKIISIKNYEFYNLKNLNNKYIMVKGYISTIDIDNGCFVLMEEQNGRNHMIYCYDNALIRNWVNSNNICENKIAVTIYGQITATAKSIETNHLLDIVVFGIEVAD